MAAKKTTKVTKKTTTKTTVKTRKKSEVSPLWVGLVIDESGSMGPYTGKTIDGFNEFLQDRKKDSLDYPVRVFMVKFQSSVTVLADGVDANDVSPLNHSTYRPGGLTALYDGIGKVITQIDSSLAEHSGPSPKILVCSMTDGAENDSKFFTAPGLREIIRSREAAGNWTFTFMGTSKESVLGAQRDLGMVMANTAYYDNTTVTDALRGVSIATTNLGRTTNSLRSTNFYMGQSTAEGVANSISSVGTSAPVKKTRKKKTSTT